MVLSLSNLRQSAAEILACAVVDLFPGAYLVNSTATEFGFYYDFIAEQPIDEHALVYLEEKMRALIKQDLEVRSVEMMRENAASFFEHKKQPFVAQRVLNAAENIVTLFQIGEFNDYCPYPHIHQTHEIGAIKLLKIEKAIYYLPEEGGIEVTRIHGTAQRDSYALKKLIKALDAGKKKDHRLIGKELDLYSIQEHVNPVACCWSPQGALLREALLDWWRKEHRQLKFLPLATPPLVQDDLMQQGGAYEGLLESEYPPISEIEGVDYVVPTRLSPTHAMIFRSKSRHYSDLPIRYAECSYVMNTDPKKHLWGMHAAQFVYADQANVFCAPEHVENELISSLQFIDKIIKMFNFEYHWYLKGQDTKFAGSQKRWEKCLSCFADAFEKCGLSYTFDETEGMYSGPTAEARLVDAYGREWKGPSIGFDFSSPDRFDLSYQGVNGESPRPVMLVRALFGSLERFIAILIEHHAGQLPVWIAPEQVRVIAVKTENNAEANRVFEALVAKNYRATCDERDVSLGAKIHAAESEHIPYIVIVGEKEEKQNLITVRFSVRGATQGLMTPEAFIEQLQQEVSNQLPLGKLRERLATKPKL